ncbi:hypothetical protein D3C83_103910 [compost metagenome]
MAHQHRVRTIPVERSIRFEDEFVLVDHRPAFQRNRFAEFRDLRRDDANRLRGCADVHEKTPVTACVPGS